MSTSEIRRLKEILEAEIEKSSNVFIIGHNSPDFDSIGSCIGLYAFAKYYSKNVYIIVDDNELKIEPGVKRILEESSHKYPYIKKSDFLSLVSEDSLLIVADTNKEYMISVRDSLDKVGSIIIIDHHEEDSHTIKTDKKWIRTEASSASEIVARVLNLSKTHYSKRVANYLLVGICLDTHRFKQNTTSVTHDVAQKLLEHGANIDYVNSLFLEEFGSYCRISNLIVDGTTIKKYSESLLAPIQVSFTLNPNQPGEFLLKEDYAKAADKMLSFHGIDASFVLGYVDEETVHISARGNKKVNVGKIMQAMGGGGNEYSAGGRIITSDLEGVENELMEKVPIGISPEEDIYEEPPVIKVKKRRKKRKKH